MSPLLSVIVPVYNTASFLPKCLDSIIGQSYSNLQILLVDDGSPDNSGAICEDYAKKDSRIEVIHQKNQGISGARNTGLEQARGEYIAFVDSDDYIDQDMYQAMMSAAINDRADLVIDDFFMILETGISRKTNGIDKSTPRESILDMFLSDNIKSYLWNKLYHKKLFEHVRFTKIREFEDLLIFPDLVKRAEKISVIHHAGYYYNCLNMSAMTASFNLKRHVNVATKYGLFCAWKQHEKVAAEVGSGTADYAEKRAVTAAVQSIIANSAHHVLAEHEVMHVNDYLKTKRHVKISGKYRFLYWCASHCAMLCNLYDYGSFVWRKHKAKANKLRD